MYGQLESIGEYRELELQLGELLKKSPEAWADAVRGQVKEDFFFFARYVSSSGKIPAPAGSGVERAVDHPFIWKGYLAVQKCPWGVIDVWPRGHWKSQTKSRDLPLWQFILYDGKLCQAIVSVLKNLAEKHLSALMVEMESNPLYPLLWPELFFKNPKQEARPWSYEKGCNQKVGMEAGRGEAQFEARGLENQPTGAHFDRIYFDDCEHEETVGNATLAEQARQNYRLWSGLENESAPGGPRRTHHGTFYEVGGLNSWLIEEELARFRHRDCVDAEDDDPAYVDVGGRPLYLSVERLLEKKALFGENYASQMRGDPKKGRKRKLDKNLLQFFERRDCQRIFDSGTGYILVDPNGFADDSNDRCAILVAVLGQDRNVYLVHMWQGRPGAIQRVDQIIQTHRRWFRPHAVFIEEVAAEADSAWIATRQAEFNHRFPVTSVQVPRHVTDQQGKKKGLKKFTRIYNAVQPLLEDGRLWVPREYWADLEGKEADYTGLLRKEMDDFPLSRAVNMLAALALLFAQGDHKKAAPDLVWPAAKNPLDLDFDQHGRPIGRDAYGHLLHFRTRAGASAHHYFVGGRGA